MKIALISLWFQIFWFAAVIYGRQYPEAIAVIMVATVCFIAPDPRYRKRIFIIALLGIVVDSVNHAAYVFLFPTHDNVWIPLWLVALWFMFSWYVVSIREVIKRTSRSVIVALGGVGGALSYLAGYKLGAVEFGFSTPLVLITLIGEWVLLSVMILKVLNDE